MKGNWENFNPFELVKNVTEVQMRAEVIDSVCEMIGVSLCLISKVYRMDKETSHSMTIEVAEVVKKYLDKQSEHKQEN